MNSFVVALAKQGSPQNTHCYNAIVISKAIVVNMQKFVRHSRAVLFATGISIGQTCTSQLCFAYLNMSHQIAIYFRSLMTIEHIFGEHKYADTMAGGNFFT